jgi:hypothetical protein
VFVPESFITAENGPLPETGRPTLRLVKVESLRTRSIPVRVLVSLSKYCSRSFDQIDRTDTVFRSARTYPAVANVATMPRCDSLIPLVIPTARSTEVRFAGRWSC